jgi:dTDP-4-amino-4,6-dideoxygalactose transaminase
MPLVPFNKPTIAGPEFDYIRQAIEAMHLAGDGLFTERCQALLREALGCGKVLLTTSCTHALEMSALLLDIKPGDEVIIPSYTFVSTANAFVLRGARPVFADVRADTLNLDESQLEGLVGERTRAVVPVHYAGVGCEMEAIMELAARRDFAVVEDNAHGLFGRYRGRNLGTFGCLATQSFHETKNFTCGEGGALVVNTPEMEDRAEVIRQKGTNRNRFLQGEVDKYTWVDLGSSYPPSEILAAFLLAQLEAREDIQARRRAIWERYQEGLADWAAAYGVGVPYVPPHCDHAYHMYYLVMPDGRHRRKMIDYLARGGISSVFHYQALHLSDMGRSFGYGAGDCPVAERMSDCLLRLPFHLSLDPTLQDYVIAAVRGYPWSTT